MGLRDWYLKRKASGLAHDVEEGKQGEMAQDAMGRFKASPGYRSAVMLLLLVVEGGAKALGFDAGPLFLVIRAFFGAIGVSPTEATALGIDPEQLVAGMISVYFAVHRLVTVYKERKHLAELEEAKKLAEERAALALAAQPIPLPPPTETK